MAATNRSSSAASARADRWRERDRPDARVARGSEAKPLRCKAFWRTWWPAAAARGRTLTFQALKSAALVGRAQWAAQAA